MKNEEEIKDRVDILTDELLKSHGYKSVLLRKRLIELKWVLE